MCVCIHVYTCIHIYIVVMHICMYLCVCTTTHIFIQISIYLVRTGAAQTSFDVWLDKHISQGRACRKMK